MMTLSRVLPGLHELKRRRTPSWLSTLEGAGLTRLDLRIYVLDVALFGTLDYADSELILDHAAASDVILLNKTDLAAKANRRALRHWRERVLHDSICGWTYDKLRYRRPRCPISRRASPAAANGASLPRGDQRLHSEHRLPVARAAQGFAAQKTVHDYLGLWNWDGTLDRIHHASLPGSAARKPRAKPRRAM